jgi:hypothetical protein
MHGKRAAPASPTPRRPDAPSILSCHGRREQERHRFPFRAPPPLATRRARQSGGACADRRCKPRARARRRQQWRRQQRRHTPPPCGDFCCLPSIPIHDMPPLVDATARRCHCSPMPRFFAATPNALPSTTPRMPLPLYVPMPPNGASPPLFHCRRRGLAPPIYPGTLTTIARHRVRDLDCAARAGVAFPPLPRFRLARVSASHASLRRSGGTSARRATANATANATVDAMADATANATANATAHAPPTAPANGDGQRAAHRASQRRRPSATIWSVGCVGANITRHASTPAWCTLRHVL